jgi:hypothetical protein
MIFFMGKNNKKNQVQLNINNIYLSVEANGLLK